LVLVGLGGNTSETLEAFSRTRAILNQILESAKFSSLYLTEPQLDSFQPPFWNAVMSGHWNGSAESLLERLLMIESREGRERNPSRPKGPRTLDLDLLVFGELITNSKRLVLPHSRMSERRFVLEPLQEISPGACDPKDGHQWSEGLLLVANQGVDRTNRTW